MRPTTVVVAATILAVAVVVGVIVSRSTGPAHQAAPPSGGHPTAPGASLPGATGASGIALGVYVKPSGSSGSPITTLQTFEAGLGRHLAIVNTFTSWETPAGSMTPFPEAFASYAATSGSTPMITWQPEQGVSAAAASPGALRDEPDFSLAQLISGRYDAYIRQWAQQAATFGRPVLVRLMQEPNDASYPWSMSVNGNAGPDQFVSAWRHIVGVVRDAGATNVQFVWCVGAEPAGPALASLYPGDDVTSWVAIDGYNRGRPWKSFTSIFSTVYADVTGLTSRPLMIAELGSVESPTDPNAKAAWITSAFDQEIPQQFPKIRAVLYFDATGRGFTYPLSSSTAALQAFRAVAQSPAYQGAAPN